LGSNASRVDLRAILEENSQTKNVTFAAEFLSDKLI